METLVVRYGYKEVNIISEKAIPNANQAIDTPIDYNDYAKYNNNIYNGYTDYDDDYADKTPLLLAGSPKNLEGQFL